MRALRNGKPMLDPAYLASMTMDDVRELYRDERTGEVTLQLLPQRLAKFNEIGRVLLDLGSVRDVVDVSVNGKSIATLWKPPYQADVTSALKSGENQLVVLDGQGTPAIKPADQRTEHDGEHRHG